MRCKMLRATIVNYGVGNFFSVSNALKRLGIDVRILSEPTGSEDLVVLPGVGGFKAAMETLREKSQKIIDAAESGQVILGICLGLQLLFDWSAEGKCNGLSIVPGKVTLLPDNVKRPHMGWSQLQIEREDSKLLEGIGNGAWVYFNHSYHAIPEDRDVIAATALYGVRFTAVVEKDGILGTQFHPEKSGKTGAKILGNILKILRK